MGVDKAAQVSARTVQAILTAAMVDARAERPSQDRPGTAIMGS
jgi:hypothetical protein